MSKSPGHYAQLGAFLLMVLLLVPFCASSNELYKKAEPAIYDLEALDDIKKNSDNYQQLPLFFKEADSVARLKPLTVVNKNKSFAPSKNYNCSISRYAWPDSENPMGSYVIKDGLTNPEYYEFFPYQQNASWSYYEHRHLKNMRRLEKFSDGVPKTKAMVSSEKI